MAMAMQHEPTDGSNAARMTKFKGISARTREDVFACREAPRSAAVPPSQMRNLALTSPPRGRAWTPVAQVANRPSQRGPTATGRLSSHAGMKNTKGKGIHTADFDGYCKGKGKYTGNMATIKGTAKYVDVIAITLDSKYGRKGIYDATKGTEPQ